MPTKKKAAKAAATNGSEKRVHKGRQSKYAGSSILALVDKNPRRLGSHGYKSMQIILDAPDKTILYEDFIAAGGRGEDLRYDLEKEHVTVGVM